VRPWKDLDYLAEHMSLRIDNLASTSILAGIYIECRRSDGPSELSGTPDHVDEPHTGNCKSGKTSDASIAQVS
jgi:hypothetical protein